MNLKTKEKVRLNQLKVNKEINRNELFNSNNSTQNNGKVKLIKNEILPPLMANSQNGMMSLLLNTLVKLNQKIDNPNSMHSNSHHHYPQNLFRQKDLNQGPEARLSYSNKSTLSSHPKDQIIDMNFHLINSSHQYKEAIAKIKQFLKEAIDFILSAGFKLYLDDVFSKNQTKAFCSKNIMINLKRIFQRTQDFISWQDTLRLVEEINSILKNIVTANLKNYPQKVQVGISQRVKEAIPMTNLLESDEYDFLYLNKINIEKKKQTNYFSEIMKTLNKMIEVPLQSISPHSQLTFFDLFKEIMTMMVVYSTQECFKGQQKKIKNTKAANQFKQKKHLQYSSYIRQLIQIQVSEKIKKQFESSSKSQKLKQFFSGLFKTKEIQDIQQKVTQTVKDKAKKMFFKNQAGQIEQNQQSMINQTTNQAQIKQTYQNYLDDHKVKDKLKSFFINTKISSKVKKYSKEQIEDCRFEIKDSTILRILSKWTEELQQKFTHPHQKICKRTQKFKNNKFSFTDLEELQFRQNQVYFLLVEYLENIKKSQIDPFINTIKKQNFKHQHVFGQLICSGEFLKDSIANIGVFSSNIQSMTSSYAVNYLNCLINQLAKIPQYLVDNGIFNETDSQGRPNYDTQTKQQIKNINLITLKIGDLMRGKFSCSQNEFIRFINILQVFSRVNSNIIKIIRVKNRMQAKDNDILINLLFMNKIQCEFQLSINEGYSNEAAKQKKTNQFNHYLYEISRNVLGPISELAGILTHEDSLISQYIFKEIDNLNKKVVYKNQINFQKYNQNQYVVDYYSSETKMLTSFLPYVCSSCKKISKNYNSINCRQSTRICLNCFVENNKKIDYQQKQKRGLQLMRTLWKIIHQKQTFKANQLINQQNYPQFVDFFDHKSIQTFEYSSNFENFANSIPSFGYYVDVNKKNPEFRVFLKQILNQQVVLFKINDVQRKNKLLKQDKIQNIILERQTDIIGIFEYKNSKKEQSWIKAIPKNYILWKNIKFQDDFTKQLLDEFNKIILSEDEQKFVQNYIKNPNLTQKKIDYQNILQDQISEKLMMDVIKQRRSQININRFSKVNDRIFKNIFNIYRKQALLIKQFRANNAIKLQENHNDKNWLRQLKNLQTLFLKNNKISEISFLIDLKNLIHLDLQGNLISSLNSMQNLKGLKILNLNKNQLVQFFFISELKSLTHLHLSENKITNLKFNKAENLVFLDISKNELTKISSLQNLIRLKQIDISGNHLENCDFISKNTLLQVVKIDRNLIKDISFVKNLQKLNFFSAKQNKIQNIQSISLLKVLQFLYLDNNQITNIQNLSNMAMLTQLSLTKNKIQKIKQLKDLPLLKEIKLKQNPLKNIGLITNIPNLKTLDLQRIGIEQIQKIDLQGIQFLRLNENRLNSIDFLGNLPRLTQLWLQQNIIQIQQGKSEQIMLKLKKNLRSIKKIDLNENKIKDMSVFCGLQTLFQLYLSKNQITKIPDQISQLRSLTDLDLSFNAFAFVGQLKSNLNLKSLCLNNCNILDTSFLISLTKLTYLNLSFNNIRQIESLRNLNALSVLIITNNHLQNIQPIKKLLGLNHLQIQYNRIKSIQCLIQLPRIMRIYLNNNQVSLAQQNEFKTKIRKRGVLVM